jgi:hypothetical protein
MHATAKRFVLRMSASAQTEMLPRRTFRSGHVASNFVDNSDTARDPVRAILGNFNRWSSMLVNLVAGFYSVDAVTEGSRRAAAHCLDYFVHSRTARRNEWLSPDVEYGSQSVGAEPRVGTDAAIIEDLELLTVVRVPLILNPLWVFRS